MYLLHSRKLRRYRLSIKKYIFLACLICIFLLLIFSFYKSTLTIIQVSKKYYNYPLVTTSVFENTQKNDQILQTAIQKELIDAKGTYSIGILDLNTNHSFYFNQQTFYNTASLYKIWIMAIVYQQIQEGILQSDDVISIDAATLNKELEVPLEEAEQPSGIIRFTIQDALEKMITLSDNNAALLLTHAIKLSSVKKFLKENNFNHSHGGEIGHLPSSNSEDIVLFFDKLYHRKFANEKYTNAMIELLKKQELNTIIPKYLPSNTSIAHKTGAIDLFTHDAGIIFIRDYPYVLVTLSNTDSPPAAEERMARISKNVYEHFFYKSQQEKKDKVIYATMGISITAFLLLLLYTIKHWK
jgi:beta-lactamase class A